MPEQDTKTKTSMSLDEDVVERIDDIPGVKRSTLVNDVMSEWLDDNGY